LIRIVTFGQRDEFGFGDYVVGLQPTADFDKLFGYTLALVSMR